MKHTLLFLALLLTLTGCATSSKLAADGKPAAQPEFKLPPGWTEADMQACMVAGTPGKMHERLAKDVGAWKGTTTMWMYPGAEPVTAPAATTVTSIMDGRYTRTEWAGDMPGMGPYKGLGLQGYDNLQQKLVNLWLDNQSTAMLQGTGEISADGSVITWTYTYTCPVTHKPTTMRQIETNIGANKKTLVMFGAEPKTGQEFKMMAVELTRE